MRLNVVTTVYNGANTIARAMESVKRLDPNICKHWIIDDCSVDNSANVIQSNLRQSDYYSENALNFGASFSRNELLAMLPDDELVMNLDQDDSIDAESVYSAIAAYEPNSVLVGEVIKIVNGTIIYERRVFNWLIDRMHRDGLRLLSIFFWPPRLGSVIFPVHRLKQIGGFGSTRYGGEDWVIFYRLLGQDVKLKCVKYVFLHRYVHGQNESIKNRSGRLKNWYKISLLEVETKTRKILLLISYIYKLLRS